jgi:CheY-like chemotaxis protein
VLRVALLGRATRAVPPTEAVARRIESAGGPARLAIDPDELVSRADLHRFVHPYVVEPTRSGALALAMLAALAPFDVVRGDLHLTDLNERDLYREAGARSPELRACFVFMLGDRATCPPGVEE